MIDDADATLNIATAATWYADTDSDGYGTSATTTLACAQPGGYVGNDFDCDDSNGALNPDTIWWRDVDNDGYGVTDTTTTSCIQPADMLPTAQTVMTMMPALAPNLLVRRQRW